MSIFNEPEFQKMVRGVKLHRVWSLARCIYCWAFLLVPLMFLEEAAAALSRLWLWMYLLAIIGLFVWGIARKVNNYRKKQKHLKRRHHRAQTERRGK